MTFDGLVKSSYLPCMQTLEPEESGMSILRARDSERQFVSHSSEI